MNATIAVDAMGGDFGVEVTVPAVIQCVSDNPDLTVLLVGNQDSIKAELRRVESNILSRIEVQHATQVVLMDDLPSKALRGKKDSSMRVAINAVKDGRAQACVSAGNTGALMATARFVLKTLPGIDRPAIVTKLPNLESFTHVLDLGANADCTAEQLLQFAIMANVLAETVDGIKNPTVGLLNIGTEEVKGTELVQQAAELIGNAGINFAGFVEGNDIFTGRMNIVVTDGFTGNAVLKSIEGVAQMIGQIIKEEYTSSVLRKFSALLSKPVLNSIQERIDHRQYNGASLLGLRGIVVKSHGGADVLGFQYAVQEAIAEMKHKVPERIGEQVESILTKEQVA